MLTVTFNTVGGRSHQTEMTDEKFFDMMLQMSPDSFIQLEPKNGLTAFINTSLINTITVFDPDADK